MVNHSTPAPDLTPVPLYYDFTQSLIDKRKRSPMMLVGPDISHVPGTGVVLLPYSGGASHQGSICHADLGRSNIDFSASWEHGFEFIWGWNKSDAGCTFFDMNYPLLYRPVAPADEYHYVDNAAFSEVVYLADYKITVDLHYWSIKGVDKASIHLALINIPDFKIGDTCRVYYTFDPVTSGLWTWTRFISATAAYAPVDLMGGDNSTAGKERLMSRYTYQIGPNKIMGGTAAVERMPWTEPHVLDPRHTYTVIFWRPGIMSDATPFMDDPMGWIATQT